LGLCTSQGSTALGHCRANTRVVMLSVNKAKLPSLSQESSYWWGPCSGSLWHEALGSGGFPGLSPALLRSRAGCEGCSVWSCWLSDFSANLCFPAPAAARVCFHSSSRFNPSALRRRHASLAAVWEWDAERKFGVPGSILAHRSQRGQWQCSPLCLPACLAEPCRLPTAHNY